MIWRREQLVQRPAYLPQKDGREPVLVKDSDRQAVLLERSESLSMAHDVVGYVEFKAAQPFWI